MFKIILYKERMFCYSLSEQMFAKGMGERSCEDTELNQNLGLHFFLQFLLFFQFLSQVLFLDFSMHQVWTSVHMLQLKFKAETHFGI